MKNIKLDIKEARKKGEGGLRQAIDTTENLHPGWSEIAYEYFKKWLSRKPSGYRFQVEDFRLRVQISKAIAEPNHPRAFGGVVVKARNERLIKSTGPKPTKSVTAHGCFSNEWKKI